MHKPSIFSVIHSRQRGFSLIEVLVALFVLSIGLLGLAGLQTLGLKFNTQSYQRTQAVLNAYDIIDRMRANPVGVAAFQYDVIALIEDPDLPNPDCSAAAADCDGTEMAAYDVDQWLASLGTLLTQGDGVVCRGILDADLGDCTPVAGNAFQIGVQWQENDLPFRMIVEAQL